MQQPTLELIGGYGEKPAAPEREQAAVVRPDLYTPELLASLTDGELAAHYFDTIIDLGPADECTKKLWQEAQRRNLTRNQLNDAFDQLRRESR